MTPPKSTSELFKKACEFDEHDLPREYWLVKYMSGGTLVFEHAPGKHLGPDKELIGSSECIHVVEHSALTRLRPLLEQAQKCIEAGEEYRRFEFCDCGCEYCDDCAKGCAVRGNYDEALASLRAAIGEGK